MPTTSLPEVLKTAISRALSEIHTCLPARVESYDHTQQRASVQPMIKKKYRDGVVEALPVIVNVPVVFPRTAMGSFTFPVNQGDYVMLTFSERAMERFLALGSSQEPGDTRRFDLTDAIAMPGLYPFNEVSLTENNKDSLWVFKKNKIRLKDNGDLEIEVSNNAKVQVQTDATVEIKGKATVTVEGDTVLNVGGNVSATIGGTADIDVSGMATITASDIDITAGLVNVTGNVAVSGTIDAQGVITSTSDVVGGGISLNSHTHGGVQSGGSNTSGPS